MKEVTEIDVVSCRGNTPAAEPSFLAVCHYGGSYSHIVTRTEYFVLQQSVIEGAEVAAKDIHRHIEDYSEEDIFGIVVATIMNRLELLAEKERLDLDESEKAQDNGY